MVEKPYETTDWKIEFEITLSPQQYCWGDNASLLNLVASTKNP